MKNRIRKMIGMLFIVITMTAFFSFKTNALSLSYSGSSTSNGTGASASTSGYTISYDAASSNICGYRFSIVSSNGLPKSGTRVLNVYKTDLSIGSTAYSSGQRFISSANVAANKKQLANGTYVYSTTTTQGCDCYSTAAGFYSTIPQSPSSIGDWIKNSNSGYLNLQRIYYYCGSNLANATESDYVLIEPIFWVKLAGVRTAATATELAIYGASVSGGDAYNGGNGNLYNAGSGTLWNLMNYINREFPNALYVSANTDVYSAVSVISSGRYTYSSIISYGYGCSVLTVKNVIPIKKVYIAYHPNGGTTNTSLNEWGWVMLNGTVYFHTMTHGNSDDPYNASTFGMTRAGYTFKGWQVYSTGVILNQDTSYASTVYADYRGSNMTTANTSEVYCYLYAQWEAITYTNNIDHWAWGFKGNGHNSGKDAFKLTSTSFSKKYGETFILDKTYACKIPNGFSLNNKWGTGSLSNSWTAYTMGTSVTQKAGNIYVEYDYSPITYNISYDLNGGTNNSSNPSTYNVLYGVTLNNPTKNNADFLGWDMQYNKDVTLPVTSNNWNYNIVMNNVKPNVTYNVTIDSAKLLNGTSENFTCLLYDFTSLKELARVDASFGNDVTFSITCPSHSNPNNYVGLLLYAGTVGNTSGKSAQYDNVTIEFSSDSINKGCGSYFSSSDVLYTELEKRLTGDIKFIAKWEENKEIELDIVPIEPNAPYRLGTEVVTSYWILNCADFDITPEHYIAAELVVYDGDTNVGGGIRHDIVIPEMDKNLIYFKWQLPEEISSDKLRIECILMIDYEEYKVASEEYSVTPYTVYSTPDTQYEKYAPSGFTVPSIPENSHAYARWWEYEYNNGNFIKKDYGLGIDVTDTEKVYSESNDSYIYSFLIKSGYPFSTYFINSISQVSGYDFPNTNAYTDVQYINAKFPEFGYQSGDGFSRTLLKDEFEQWQFRNNGSYGSVHFIPLYYPDGDYYVAFEKSDLWTPAGMIKGEMISNPLVIEGDAYDDWYIGR